MPSSAVSVEQWLARTQSGDLSGVAAAAFTREGYSSLWEVLDSCLTVEDLQGMGIDPVSSTKVVNSLESMTAQAVGANVAKAPHPQMRYVHRSKEASAIEAHWWARTNGKHASSSTSSTSSTSPNACGDPENQGPAWFWSSSPPPPSCNEQKVTIKSVAELKPDNKPGADETAEYLYLDDQDRQRGPFSRGEMREWFQLGYFEPRVKMKRVADASFTDCSELLGGEGAEPAAADPGKPEWVYLDDNRRLQGPFSLGDMRAWYAGGFFEPEMMVKRMPDPAFVQVKDCDVILTSAEECARLAAAVGADKDGVPDLEAAATNATRQQEHLTQPTNQEKEEIIIEEARISAEMKKQGEGEKAATDEAANLLYDPFNADKDKVYAKQGLRLQTVDLDEQGFPSPVWSPVLPPATAEPSALAAAPKLSQRPTVPPYSWMLPEWHFIDMSNVTRGPFTLPQMRKWYSGGFFPDWLLVKREGDSSFAAVGRTPLISGAELREESTERKNKRPRSPRSYTGRKSRKHNSSESDEARRRNVTAAQRDRRLNARLSAEEVQAASEAAAKELPAACVDVCTDGVTLYGGISMSGIHERLLERDRLLQAQLYREADEILKWLRGQCGVTMLRLRFERAFSTPDGKTWTWGLDRCRCREGAPDVDRAKSPVFASVEAPTAPTAPSAVAPEPPTTDLDLHESANEAVAEARDWWYSAIDTYYISEGGRRRGPFTLAQMVAMRVCEPQDWLLAEATHALMTPAHALMSKHTRHTLTELRELYQGGKLGKNRLAKHPSDSEFRTVGQQARITERKRTIGAEDSVLAAFVREVG